MHLDLRQQRLAVPPLKGSALDRMQPTRRLAGTPAIAAASLVLGLAAGVGLTRSSSTRPEPRERVSRAADAPPPSMTAATSAPAVTVAPLSEPDKAALRAMIREELAAARPPPVESHEPSPAATLERPISNDDLKAYDQVRAIVADGLHRGSWTEEDRAHARRTLGSLPPEMRLELVGPLIVAVNQQKVRFEGTGPLL